MRIFDCFLYFNEVEVLNIRFHELWDVVDYHVIVEGTTTFSGQPRDIGFDVTDPRWAPFIEKVIHVVVDDTPEEIGAWDRETFQRNAILRGLDTFQPDRSGPLCNSQDLVLISDADEIPSAEAVRWVASRLVRGVAAFELSFSYYHLNQLVCQPSSGDTIERYEPISWWLARAARRADIRWPQEVRDSPLHDCAHVAPHGGWHFSYLGGVQRIQTKIAAFSHQELNHPQFTDAANIAGAISSGRDLFGRDSFYRFQTVPINDRFPRYVVENQELFAAEIKTIEESTSNTTLDIGAQSVNRSVSNRPITRIIEATYGDGADVVDVTAQLQERLRDGHLRLTVSNTLFGDPCLNRVKTLRFTYEVAGDSRQHRHEVEENRIVSLGAVTTLLPDLHLPQATNQHSSIWTQLAQVEPSDCLPTCAHLYLDLLKTCLTRLLFEHDHHELEAAARVVGRSWPPDAETKIGLRRLDNIEYCITEVLRQDVSGDLVDAGVWRGGSAIFMRAVLKAGAVRNRTVWAADSFAANVQDREHEPSTLTASLEEVKLNFARYNLLDEQVGFLAGQFHDTLPTTPIDRISILRLAGASYEATLVALQALYRRLSVGGYVIIDDYGAVTGSRQATDDFRGDHGLTEPIQWVDWSGAYWQKSE